jgi:hypothetical protein
MRKKSFVMTGHVSRNTCNCGCVSSNTFWQEGGFGGSSHLSHLHADIEKFLDELSGAEPGKNGNSCDVKVTVTVEELGLFDHRILHRNSFSGLGYEDNIELKKKILEPSAPEDPILLYGEDEFGTTNARQAEYEIKYDLLQDIHDRILLVQRTGDTAKLEELRQSIASMMKLDR